MIDIKKSNFEIQNCNYRILKFEILKKPGKPWKIHLKFLKTKNQYKI